MTVTVNAVVQAALLLSWQNQVGSKPAEIEFELYGKVISNVNITAMKGKLCTVVITTDTGPITLFTGYIVDWKPVYSDAPPGGSPECNVTFSAVDYRWILAGDFIGRKQLDTLDGSGVTTVANGIPVLGADINFNRQTPFEHNNMDATTGIFNAGAAPKFVYEKADTGDGTDCNHTDSIYWTYGDAIYWILAHYGTILTAINVSGTSVGFSAASYAAAVGSFTDLARTCEDIDIFGMNVADALDELFSRTNSNWYLDGTNTLVIFSRQHPDGTDTLTAADPENPLATTNNYNLDIPCSLRATGSIRNVVSKVDVIGGTTIREIQAGAMDFNAPIISFASQLVPPPVLAAAVAGAGTVLSIWQNFSLLNTVRYGFNHANYATHKAGKNIRVKDIAKPVSGELLLKRDFNGQYVNPDNECGIYGVNNNETIFPFWFYGGTVDLDRAEIDATCIGAIAGTPPPQQWVMPVETEIRSWIEASVPLSTLPFDRYIGVVRDDLRQKNRELIHVPFPVKLQVIQNALGITYTILSEPIPLPAGWTKDYEATGSITAGVVPAFTVSVPAGVVFDALGALQNLADNSTSEIGRERCDLEGSFPLFRSLPMGTQLTLVGDGWTETATGQECVVAVHFDGQTQQFSFAATNYIGPNAVQLASGFIGKANYRRGI